MAPTKTAILCVVGRVGRYVDKRWVGQSPERAGVHNKRFNGEKKKKRRERNILILTVLGGRWSTTGFCDCGSKREKEESK